MALYYLVPPFKGSGLVFNLVGLSSTAAILLGIRLHKPESRLAWYLFALGQFLFVSGDAFYYGYDAVFHHDVSFPSLGDIFYLAVYPALIGGVLILVRRRNPRGDRAGLIDALILTTGLALVSWVFLMAPYAHDSTLSLVEKLFSIAYPLMDVCLLAVAIRLSVDGGLRQRSLGLLLLSIVALLTTDAILGVLTLNGGYNEGGLLDAGWATYYVFWGAAALHPSMKGLERHGGNPDGRLTRQRLALLTAASLMPPAVQAVQAIRNAPAELPVVIATSVIVFGLVIARMAGLLRETERAAAQEKSLREATRTLIGASSLDEVHRAALSSMRSLVGADHWVRLTLLAPSGELRAQAWDVDGGKEEWLVRAADLTSLDAASLRELGALEVDLHGSTVRRSLRFPDQAKASMLFPLFVRQELRGLVFVAGTAPFPKPMKAAMQTLAVKIALTLESAILAEDLHRRESEARFKSLVQNSSDVITVIGPGSKIEYQSPSIERVLGYEPDELVGSSFAELLHAEERDHVLALIADVDSPQASDQVVECRLRHANGEWLVFEILRTNLSHDPNVAGIVLNARDISERKQFEQQLTHQAFHDDVTNLANRALFTNRVEHALARQTRDEGGLAVLFVDLDDFKLINDSLGHAAGDVVLAEVGARLTRCVRPMDTVARFGGDEYALLVEDVQRLDEVAAVADRIFELLSAPIRVEQNDVVIRASIGITLIDGEDAMTSAADELMRNADVAMYRAKREGKGHYRVFEPQMHASVLEHLEMKGALEKALERKELKLYYQPIVDLPEGRVKGLEALVRWHHPQRGIVMPGEFIPLAEETGMIVELGKWILGEACRQLRFMQDLALAPPSLTMAVNISVKQLQQPGLVATVAEAIAAAGVKPSCLTLEITESVLMIDTEATITKLHELKALGVRLSVDDFGTGYSSLGYLSRFPVDVLKIDQTFVSQIDGLAPGSVLIAAIVKLGEALGLQTVAEGIERPEQSDRLTQLGCPLGQGYYYSKPMNIDTTLEYLASESSTVAPNGAPPRA
ncbi:MAG: EAL domain-containing protein [Actinobacteria bacterium]|nr:EAL domain-containing protein [Actinomycetota bacterium]